MSIEKGKISGLELMFSITAFIQGSLLYVSFTSNITKHDSWLVVISGFVVIIPFAIIYSSLAKLFPGMNLVQIHDSVYGRYIGKVISILYIYYFLVVLSYNIREFGDYYTISFMPDSPLIFFLIVFTLICALAVWMGIEVICRISHLFVVIAYLISISTFILLLPQMNFSNFLPVVELPMKKFIQGTHIITAVSSGEIVVFLMVMAALDDTRHITRNTLVGLLMGGISFLIISVRNIAILGNADVIFFAPTLQATRLIDVGNIFTRMDILIGIGQVILLFFKSSVFYYAAVVSLAQLLRLKSYLTIILPIGGIEVVLAIIDWESRADDLRFLPSTSPIHVTPFIFIFPLLTLLIGKIRSIPKKEGVKRK